MTERKRWPNEAKWARENAIAYAMRGLRALEPIIQQEVQPERLRGAAVAADCFHRIIADLAAGATQPGEVNKEPAP